MTLVQQQRARLAYAVLCGVPQAGEEASTLFDELRLWLRAIRAPNEVVDPDLDEAIVAAESLLVRLRERPPGTERRKTPRYPVEAYLPVRIERTTLHSGADAVITDVGLGGLRLVAHPIPRPALWCAEPIEIAFPWSDAARASEVGGAVLRGTITRTASDDTGVTLHVRCDPVRGGDRQLVDRWVEALARDGFAG